MDLVLDGNGPLYRQLARALRSAIANGRLRDGERLPPTRVFAHDLDLSRTTVLAAFEQLRAEGLLTGKVGSGSYVRSARQSLAPLRPVERSVVPQSEYSRRARRIHDPDDPDVMPGRRLPGMRFAFQFGLPIVNHRLTSQWTRELQRAAPVTHPNYPRTQGLPALREALCRHIAASRGVPCTPDDILIVNGVQQAMSLLCRVLLDVGDEVVIEEPHYFGARRVLQMHGARVTGVAVDGQGLRTDLLPDRRVKLVCVTPSHQFPTGAVLSLPRRHALLDRARDGGEWICEDDYDGEFRHDRTPVEALRSLDRDGRVIYIGSFSKTLFPALRLGYVVMPASLRGDFIAAKWADDFGSGAIEQAALANLIASGAYDRHLRFVTRTLTERRRVLRGELLAQCGGEVEILDASSGMHLMIWLKNFDREQGDALVRSAHERKLGLYSVTPCYLSPPPHAGLLMGFSAMSVKEIPPAVAIFAACLREALAARRAPRRLFLAHSA